MTPTARRNARLVALMLAVGLLAAVLGPVHAATIDSGRLSAASARFGSGTSQSGQARLANLHHFEGAADASPFDLAGTAQSVRVDLYESDFTVIRHGGAQEVIEQPRGNLNEQPTSTFTALGATVETTGVQDVYACDLFGATPFTLTMAASGARVRGLSHAVLEPTGIYSDPSGAVGPGDRSDSRRWTHATVGSPQALFEGDASSATATASGDFIVELSGPQLTITDAAGKATAVATGTTESSAAPLPTGDGVYTLHTSFARLTVTGGNLVATMASPAGAVLWSADEATARVDGAQLTDVSGQTQGAAGTTPVDAAAYTLDGPQAFAVKPAADGSLDLALGGAMPGPAQPALTTAARLPTEWALALGGLLVLAAIGALGVPALVARSRPQPSQMDIEAALGRGDFQHAARLGRRVLARSPGQEDAVIARAIALAKGGQPARVVAELTRHLRKREPSDGVTHYVLGLAYLDLGFKDKAAEALREAVRRTPSLAGEVESRMPRAGKAAGNPSAPSGPVSPPAPVAASPLPELSEVHGYA